MSAPRWVGASGLLLVVLLICSFVVYSGGGFGAPEADRSDATILDWYTDSGNQVRVLGQVRRLAAQGIAVLMSSHQPDHALQIADRALLLGEGRCLELGKPQEVINAGSLKRLYGVDVRIVETGKGVHTCLPDYALRQ